MMFNRFPTESRHVATGAQEIASELESPTVEAEHLLLAVARQGATPAQRALEAAGLGYDQVRDAIDAEFEGSLAAVGVSLGDFDLAATAPAAREVRWGSSAKLALVRSAKIAEARRDRRISPGHIVLGVLRAPTGTVPRALDRAGIDRAELSRSVEAAL